MSLLLPIIDLSNLGMDRAIAMVMAKRMSSERPKSELRASEGRGTASKRALATESN